MAFLFYNKPLLRILVAVTGLATIITAWHYVSLSAEKMPQHGAIDAMAIISFMIAGWLVMLIAEVIDHHYVRVFGCLAMLLGGFIAFKWVFLTDGPRLIELPAGPAGMQMAKLSYWAAIVFTLVLLTILIVRLVLDKQNLGRPMAVMPSSEEVLGETADIQPQDTPDELPPIPVETGQIETSPATQPPAEPKPHTAIAKLIGISGVYLGKQFDLSPGEMTIGRGGSDIFLESDNQVSRQHAKLQISDEMLVEIIDLGSTNGTQVNNTRIETAPVSAGDVIQIGTTMFKAEA